MKLIDKLEHKEEIKKALDIEIKNHYINIIGKTKPFCKFLTEMAILSPQEASIRFPIVLFFLFLIYYYSLCSII